MKKKDGFYIDENNNRWNCDLFTEEQAIKNSESLTGCSGCYDCSDCYDCSRCSRCSDCSGCSYCSRCSYCSDCSGCYDCSRCSRCSDCYDCYDCSRCSDCSGCSYCSGYKTNPQRFVSSKIGSRNSQTTAYWTSKEDVQIVCGCFSGDLDKFEKQVKETHANTSHLEPYLKLIEVIKCCVNYEI